LYNGPIGEIDRLKVPEDFMSLELLNGYPRLMINHGTGTETLSLDGRDKTGAVIMRKLSDGVWHHIDIIRQGKVRRAMLLNFFKTKITKVVTF
jgi:hypothetical protein